MRALSVLAVHIHIRHLRVTETAEPAMSDVPASPASKRRLSDIGCDEAERLVRDAGQPAYRARQLWSWLRERGVFDPAEMTDIPKALREHLDRHFPLAPLRLDRTTDSGDGTRKLLFRLADGRFVESVLIPARDRTTVCISSQVGCAVRCVFCASGIEGGKRNLSAGEIFEQFQLSRRLAEEEGRRLTNLVMMGMGEPMLNYRAVVDALAAINDTDGPGFGARRITVSTIGIKKGVEAFTDLETQYTLAFSLHAPNDEIRRRIVPLEAAMSVTEIRDAAHRYLRRTGREVTFEYVLLSGINDAPAQAHELAALLRGIRGSVNLIPYNPVPDLPYTRPTDADIDRFSDILRQSGVKVTERTRKGSDIDAACGQLALKAARAE